MQDDGRGHGIDPLTQLLAAPPLGAQGGRRLDRAQALVPEGDGHGQPFGQIGRVVAHPGGALPFAAAQGDGQADDQQRHPVFGDEVGVAGSVLQPRLAREDAVGAGDGARRVAEGDADALFAEVEGHDAAGGVRHW